MKNFKRIFALLIVALLAFWSCKKDRQEEGNYILESDYFTIQGAEYVKADFPSPSSGAPVIQDVQGNTNVIPGGANLIGVTTDGEADELYFGVENVDGYLRVPAAQGTGSNEYLISIMLSQNLSEENFVIVIAVAHNGSVSEHFTIPVTLVQVGTGKLQVSLTWDQANDVDLHLVEPEGGTEIYFGNPSSSNGGELDLDSNAACDIDHVNNENITYPDDAVLLAGTYVVRVDFWANCSVTEPTHYGVNVYYNGEIIAPSSGNNPASGVFQPNEEDAGDAGSGVEVMRFVIPESGTRQAYQFGFTPHNRRVLSPEKM